MFARSGKRKCTPPPELVMHNLHAIITMIMIIIIILAFSGFYAWLPRKLCSLRALSRRREVRAAPAATCRPWEMTDALALPVWMLGLMWAQSWPSTCVVWEVLSRVSRIPSACFTLPKIPPFIQESVWKLDGVSEVIRTAFFFFFNGENWGQRNDLSPQVTKFVNNKTKKGTSYGRQESKALSTRKTYIWICVLHITISAILGTFLYLEKLEVMILAYFEK